MPTIFSNATTKPETLALIEGGTTTGSAASLRLSGSGTGNGRIRFDNALEFCDTADTPANTWMYLSSAGKLGIGTILPLGFLHVSLATSTGPSLGRVRSIRNSGAS